MADKQEASPQKQQDSPFTIRESRALMAIRLMSLFLITGLAFLVILFLSASLGSFMGAGDILALNFLLFFLLFLLVLIITAFVILKWWSEYYRITPDGVTRFSGILKKKEERYACSFVEGITVDQGIIGRLFDYGSVMIYDPSQQQKICLFSIPAPHDNGNRISRMMKKKSGDKPPIPLKPSPEEPTNQ